MTTPRKLKTTGIGRWLSSNAKWLVPVAIIGIILGVWWVPITEGLKSFFGGSTVTPPGEFDVLAWDSPRNLKLPSNAFNYTLWGVTGTDLTDFGNFDELDTGDSLSDISAADLDPDYDRWVLRAAGKVEADWWDPDDAAVIQDEDTLYDHYYYNRYFVLSKTSVNTLMFYETPTDGNFIAVYSENFTVVDMTKGISAPINTTLFAGTNASQKFAKYVAGENYENEAADQPTWIITTNTTISMSWLSMQGCVKSRVNDTALKFTFGVLGPVPSVFNLIWNNNDAEDIEIASIQLLFGDKLIALAT